MFHFFVRLSLMFKCYVGNENIMLSLKSILQDGLSWISSLSQDHWAALIEKISITFSTNWIRVFTLQVLRNKYLAQYIMHR